MKQIVEKYVYKIALLFLNLFLISFSVWCLLNSVNRMKSYAYLAEYLLDAIVIIIYPINVIISTTHLYLTRNRQETIMKKFCKATSITSYKLYEKIGYFVTFLTISILILSEIISYIHVYCWDGSKYLFVVWISEILQLLIMLYSYHFIFALNTALNEYTESLKLHLRKLIDHTNKESNNLKKFVKRICIFSDIIVLISQRYGVSYTCFFFMSILHAVRATFLTITNNLFDGLNVKSYIICFTFSVAIFYVVCTIIFV